MLQKVPAHRVATQKLILLQSDGTPAAGDVHIEMTRHAFLFGCGAFDALPLTQPQTSDADRARYADRLEKWLALFNFGTLPFYWGRFEPERGKPHTEDLMNAAQWLVEQNVTVKGHPLCWHTVCADWLMELSNEEILKTQLARIHRDVAGFAGVIDMWDVINEVVIMPIFDKYDNGITRICKELGRVGMIREVFAAAREANPGSTLLLNDFNTGIDYEILIDGCLNAGIPIDAIGIQSHQHQGYWGLEKLHAVLDRFAHFGLPIHFTENTLISGDLMPAHIEDLNDWQVPVWPTTPEGEARQAREISEMYTVLFEHPLVEAITTWDHTDGNWLGAPSGVLRADGSTKPAHDALHRLIHQDWWTDLTAAADAGGGVSFTGVKGEYRVTAGRESATFTLDSGDGGPLTMRLS